MSECPKCDAEIGNAAYCGCGWKRQKARIEQPSVPSVDCAFDGCGNSAKVKILVKTGWANLCVNHYEDHFRRESQKTCNRLGLDTVEKKRKWVQENKRGLKRFTDAPMREPSEDLEEAEIAF